MHLQNPISISNNLSMSKNHLKKRTWKESTHLPVATNQLFPKGTKPSALPHLDIQQLPRVPNAPRILPRVPTQRGPSTATRPARWLPKGWEKKSMTTMILNEMFMIDLFGDYWLIFFWMKCSWLFEWMIWPPLWLFMVIYLVNHSEHHKWWLLND